MITKDELMQTDQDEIKTLVRCMYAAASAKLSSDASLPLTMAQMLLHRD